MNTKLPEGTSVLLTLDDGSKIATRTRSLPWQLGHGAWVVLVEGKTGGWALERVEVAGNG
jgi:hypothetical protein